MSSGVPRIAATTFWLVCALSIATLPGCAPDAASTVDAPGSQSQATSKAEPNVSLSVADAAGLQAVLDKHRGKVVLVDFWATWCLPCIEQFPHTVEFAGKNRDRGLAVVSVSMDNPSAESQVRAFLEKQGAWFDNLLSSYGSPVAATKAFGLPGPVPCYRVYDRDGRLHREFTVDPLAAKQFTSADVEAAVEEVL